MFLEGTVVEKIVFVGTCGGFKDLRLGDMVIGSEAFDGEGFSRYLKEDFSMRELLGSSATVRPKGDVSSAFVKFLLQRNAKDRIKTGKIFTIGSLYAENKENLSAIEAYGFIGIDMELSAVYNAANRIETDITSLLVVSDRPFDKSLGSKLDHEEELRVRNAIAELPAIAMDFMNNTNNGG